MRYVKCKIAEYPEIVVRRQSLVRSRIRDHSHCAQKMQNQK